MKRRSQKEQPRDREMEQVKKMTRVKLTQAEIRERVEADKQALEAKIASLLRERNALRKVCLEDAGDDPLIDGTQASQRLAHLAEAIKHATASLRDLKAKLDGL